MGFPEYRPRRLRRNEKLRGMIREHELSVHHLVYPLFIKEGSEERVAIPSMPGICQFSIDAALSEIEELCGLSIPAVLLFGIPNEKDEVGSGAYDESGVIQKAIRAIKGRFGSEMLVIADLCLCEYTSHGHCGVIKDGQILNDPSIELLANAALSHARAGADLVAPSDMMDGRVGAIRRKLDEKGFQDVAILSYAAKYGSAFYGPFREAAQSTPQFGDRRSYQMDPANAREALREVALDLEEGADIIMVKPALPYLDIIARVRERFDVPVAAYNVSAEFSMVKAAAQKGWIDEQRIVLEILTGIQRAGASIILTYHAKDVARWLKHC